MATKKTTPRRARARAKTPATTVAPSIDSVAAAPAPEKKGPRRRQLPDGKGPNDVVIFADLIALGYVDAVDIQVDGDDGDA